MPCAICGGATLPAAKLCGACKAALKRARHETVSQLDPLPRRPSRARRTEKPSRAESAGSSGGGGSDAGSRPPRRERIRLPASVVALGVVAIAIGYFVSHLRGETDGPDLAAAASVPAPYVPLPTSAAPPEAVPEPFALPARAALPSPPPPPKHVLAVRPKAPSPPPQPEPEPPPVTAVAEAPPPPIAPKIQPPAPDRWQMLASAIAQCGDGLGGLLCAERARWQYCDGYWGKVAQCPGAIGADVPR